MPKPPARLSRTPGASHVRREAVLATGTLGRAADCRFHDRIARVRAEHRAIPDAILARDAGAAERAMAGRIASAQRRMLAGSERGPAR
jgi:DNA-binding FadR family transcriptional regulator